MIAFPPFHIDRRTGRLWRGGVMVALRPKAWALLLHLAERPGTLVSKEELHAAIWPGAVVSDDTLTSTVAELRRALRENARRPRIIETVHRRGFRFIAPLEPSRGVSAREAPPTGPGTVLEPQPSAIVGRDGELELLRSLFRRASAGQRQVVFVAGEPGIGKSAIVEAFVQEVRAAAAPVLLGLGQCVDQYGQREAYMPALEALERIGRTPAGKDRLLSALRTSARNWLAQMPSLESAGDAARPPRWHGDTTPQRMLREFAILIEALAADVPLLLVLEDLHWSDQGTMDLVSVFSQRPEPARAMLLATYRPAHAVALEHPIQHVLATLRARRQCTEIALECLTRADVAAYLESRFPGAVVEPDVAAAVHAQTDGNPLYMLLLVDHLLARGWLAEIKKAWRLTADRSVIARDVPDSLRQMIEEQLRFVSPAERDVLAAASICGVAFDAPMVASGLGHQDDEVESICHGLSRGKRWLRYLGSRQWPNGVVAARYAFQHALYQLALYDRVAPSRRAILHERIGRRLEDGFSDRTAEVSSELARHFEGSHDVRRALVYLEQGARRAHDRLAYGDMVACLQSALRLIGELPETPARDRDELHLRRLHGVVLSETAGYTAPALLETLTRTRELAERLGDVAALFDALCAIVHLHQSDGNLARAEETGLPLWPLAERLDAPAALLCHLLRGRLALWRGQLDAAASHLALGLGSPTRLEEAERAYGVNPVVAIRSFEALRRWVAGDVAGARSVHWEALRLAEEHGRPFTIAQAAAFTGFHLLFAAEWTEAEKLGTRVFQLADEYGFPRWLGTAQVILGRARCAHGDGATGLAEIREGLAALWQSGGQFAGSVLFSFLADACLTLGQWDEGLAAVDAGLARRDAGERLFEAELWRLRGALIRERTRATGHATPSALLEADECFDTACAVARAQGAHMLRQRAEAARFALHGEPSGQRGAARDVAAHASDAPVPEGHAWRRYGDG